MATTDAIGATSIAIREVLSRGYDADRFGGREAEFSLDLHSPVSFGLTVVLWHVQAEDSSPHQLPQRNRLGEVSLRPGLAVTLHYLVTAWAAEPPDEHCLLGWAMHTLHDAPILPAALLNDQIPGTFDPSDTITLTPEALSRSELAGLPAAAHTRPAVSYVARGVVLTGSR